MSSFQILIQPRRAAVPAGRDSTLEVLVRVQAPDRAPEEVGPRSQLHVALVIDRSGSMAGAPLAEAKRCATFVVQGLAATDAASLVVYDHTVQTLAPCAPLVDRQRLLDTIAGVEPGGSTDLHAGWFAGAETLAPHTGPRAISRVILLSDGCANHGLQRVEAIGAECAQLAAAGVTTSTYGLGRNFREDLMITMAKAGGGNSYYGQTAEDLMDPFREELALLQALCARGVRLMALASVGVRVDLRNGYRGDAVAGWALPDLPHGGEAWAVLEVHVPKALAVAGREVELLELRVQLQDAAGEPLPTLAARLVLPVVDGAAFAVLPEDELVARRAGELAAADLGDEARRAVLAGDWEAGERLLRRLDDVAVANPWLQAVSRSLRELARRRETQYFAKEAAFSSEKQRSRLAGKDERAAWHDATMAEYLRRKREQGKADSS